jgi:hypothetical protein
MAVDMSRCIALPAETIANIELGIRPQYRQNTHFSNYWAVRTRDRAQFYFAAARVGSSPDSSDWGIAVWAINRLDHSSGETGVVYAMPEIATSFTDWGNGARTQANFNRRDDGYREAVNCARG